MFTAKSFKNLFHRQKQLEFNLGNFTIKDLVNFPHKEDASMEEPFIVEIIHDNHLVVKHSASGRVNSVHHYEYLPNKKMVIIDSTLEREAYVMYVSVCMAFVLLAQSPINLFLFFFVAVSIFYVVSIILIVSLRIESQEMQRELEIRINYTLRTGKKVNVID